MPTVDARYAWLIEHEGIYGEGTIVLTTSPDISEVPERVSQDWLEPPGVVSIKFIGKVYNNHRAYLEALPAKEGAADGP